MLLETYCSVQYLPILLIPIWYLWGNKVVKVQNLGFNLMYLCYLNYPKIWIFIAICAVRVWRSWDTTTKSQTVFGNGKKTKCWYTVNKLGSIKSFFLGDIKADSSTLSWMLWMGNGQFWLVCMDWTSIVTTWFWM